MINKQTVATTKSFWSAYLIKEHCQLKVDAEERNFRADWDTVVRDWPPCRLTLQVLHKAKTTEILPCLSRASQNCYTFAAQRSWAKYQQYLKYLGNNQRGWSIDWLVKSMRRTTNGLKPINSGISVRLRISICIVQHNIKIDLVGQFQTHRSIKVR